MCELPCHPQLLKAALAIKQQYTRMAQARTDAVPLPQERWRLIERWRRMSELAELRGFRDAARRCRQRLREVVRSFGRDVQVLLDDLDRIPTHRTAPSLRLLYEELSCLFDEFGQVEINPERRELAVTTERIVLEEIDLGPFEIRLSWDELCSCQPYRVIALDPNYPSCDDHTPHPHVQGASLCEGDGQHAIERALDEGRLGEFFVLIRQILRTYNDSSPYVSLDRWQGVPCIDCGDVVNEDDSYRCDRCESRLCDHCTRCCASCDVTLCADCTERCEVCDDRACGRCLEGCSECRTLCCPDCLTETLCPACHESSLEIDDDPTEEASATDPPPPPASPPETDAPYDPETDPAVQPHSVGEADVPA